VIAAVTLLYSAISWVRSLDYVSDEAVWRHELEVNPDNPQALAGLGQFLASNGEPDLAVPLVRRAMEPSATRFGLLSNPTRCYLALVELEGPRIADGDAPALRSLLRETEDLLDGRVPDPGARAHGLHLPAPPSDEHFRIHVANAATHLAAAGALLASRLPNDEAVRRLAARASAEASLDARARYNLALALGRAGDYDRATIELDRALAASQSPELAGAAAALRQSLATVQHLRGDASAAIEPASSVARARAFLELGAYLRAARVLRPAFAVSPSDPDVQATYFDALVSARLDDEAGVVAARMPGQEPSIRLEEARRHLSERTAHAASPQGVVWWEP
jgi:tetratricopeptide (TPR) repeat protein